MNTTELDKNFLNSKTEIIQGAQECSIILVQILKHYTETIQNHFHAIECHNVM